MTTSPTLLVLLIVSACSCTGIFLGALRLNKRGTHTAHMLALMLFCICAEITLATVALFVPWHEAIRILGRGIELFGVARFLVYLYRNGHDGPAAT